LQYAVTNDEKDLIVIGRVLLWWWFIVDIAHTTHSAYEATLFQFVEKELELAYPSLTNSKDTSWQNIVNQANVISLPAGISLLQPDTPCVQFMLLLNGSVRIYQRTPNDREATLYRIHGGDLCVLSINGLMQKKDFGAYAKTETIITALTFPRELFMEAMANSAEFREFILLNLTARFNDVLKLTQEIVFENLDTRLICLLVRLSRKNENNTLRITHQKLARELGSSREVISRLLKGIEKQGCIKLGRGVIHVLL
jgi:CRP/FNR family transcriptional regulator